MDKPPTGSTFVEKTEIYRALIESGREHLAAELLYGWIRKTEITQNQFECLMVDRDTIRLAALKEATK